MSEKFRIEGTTLVWVDPELTELYIPDEVSVIGEGALRSDKLKIVHMPGYLREIEGDDIGCELDEIHIGGLGINKWCEIGDSIDPCRIFSDNTRLIDSFGLVTEISFRNNYCTTVTAQSLSGYNYLSKVYMDIGDDILEDGALSGCHNLEGIYLYGDISDLFEYPPSYSPASVGAPIYINDELLTELTVPPYVESVGNVFSGCPSIKTVVIDEGVKRIESGAFWGCSHLMSVSIPASVEEIEDGVFQYCNKLREVYNLSGVELELPSCAVVLTDYFADPVILEDGNGYKYTTCQGKTVLLDAPADDPYSLYLPERVNGNKYELCEGFAYGKRFNTLNISAGVTKIGRAAFCECRQLRTVRIEGDSLTCIDDSAFCACESLMTVNIPDSVEKIGSYAFSTDPRGPGRCKYIKYKEHDGNQYINNCLIFINDTQTRETISFKEGTVLLSHEAIVSCPKITSVSVPESVRRIPENFFAYWDGLKTAYVGSSTIIEDGAFQPQVEIIVGSDEKGGMLEEDELIAALGIEVEDGIIISYNGNSSELTIPEGIVGIDDEVFSSHNELNSVKMPSTLEFIGKMAFLHCQYLESVILNDGLKAIHEGAFYGCVALKEITVPDSVTKIEGEAFKGCECVEVIRLPKGLKSIKATAFLGCYHLKTIHLSIETEIYGILSSSIELVYDEEEGESLEELARKTYVARVDDSSSVQRLRDGIVDMKKHAGTNKPASVKNEPKPKKKMGKGAKKALITVAVILALSLAVLFMIASGFLPKYIKHIETMGELRDIISKAESGESSEVIIPDGILYIPDNAFDFTDITSVTIPQSVERIGKAAFRFCQKLETVNMGENVKVIGEKAFDTCYELKEITIPGSVNKIGKQAFFACRSLKAVVIEEGIEKIGRSAFYSCGVEYMVLPSTVRTIGNDAFAHSHLKSIVLNEGLEEISTDAFYECDNLKFVYIPSSVTTIKKYAFHFYPKDMQVACGASHAPSGWNEKWAYISNTRQNAMWNVTREQALLMALAAAMGMGN